MTSKSSFYYTTGSHRFLIERAKDFGDDGRMIDGKGWFASRVIGNDVRNGEWFKTASAAEKACDEFAETASDEGKAWKARAESCQPWGSEDEYETGGDWR